MARYRDTTPDQRMDFIWFKGPLQFHAFPVTPEGAVEEESSCGRVDLDACADEPAREKSDFTQEICDSCWKMTEG